MRKSFWFVVVVLLMICIGTMFLRADGIDVIENFKNDFNIESEAKHFKDGAKKKGAPAFKPVPLSHKKHADLYGCKKCHHELASDGLEDQKKAQKCSAPDCHSAAPKDKCNNLENAMHQQCYKDCHKTDEKAVAAKAPTKCSECHVKN